MDRPRHPRHRRKDPKRTGPIRNAGEAWRDDKHHRDSARSWDDTASHGVREGYRVIDEQIRRGHRMAQALDDEDRKDRRHHHGRGRRRYRYEDDDWRYERRRGPSFLEMPMRQIEILTREILYQIGSARPNPWRLAELILRLQLEAFSELARVGFSLFGFDARREDDFDDRDWRDDDEDYGDYDGEEEEEIWHEEREDRNWSSAPSSPATIRSTVPIPVFVWSHERTEIDLDLPPGSQSLDLEVEPHKVSGTDKHAHHPFEAELVWLEHGPTILRIEVPHHLPAGHYLRRILVRATGDPVGTLTVRVGLVKEVLPPKERKKK